MIAPAGKVDRLAWPGNGIEQAFARTARPVAAQRRVRIRRIAGRRFGRRDFELAKVAATQQGKMVNRMEWSVVCAVGRDDRIDNAIEDVAIAARPGPARNRLRKAQM